ncbi:DUF6074 family protein [Phyllobacterium sp. K27]
MRQMDLLEWSPPCQIVVFPLNRRVGRVREVATNFLAKGSEKGAANYLSQVSGGLFAQLDRMGVPMDQREEMLCAFFGAVEKELKRLSYQQQPGGAA